MHRAVVWVKLSGENRLLRLAASTRLVNGSFLNQVLSLVELAQPWWICHGHCPLKLAKLRWFVGLKQRLVLQTQHSRMRCRASARHFLLDAPDRLTFSSIDFWLLWDVWLFHEFPVVFCILSFSNRLSSTGKALVCLSARNNLVAINLPNWMSKKTIS